MNNPNPFVPKGSLLELQGKRRSRLKIAVFCVLAVSVTGLTAMLIQGCKRTVPDTEVPPPIDTNSVPPLDTGFPPMNEVSNPPVVPPLGSNSTVALPPMTPTESVAPTPAPIPAPVPEPSAGSEYTVVKGDSLAKIAKAHGVSLSALQAANPGVIPTKLRIGQKLVIPAGSPTAAVTAPSASFGGAETVYTVKSGDTLSKIAKMYGTTYKAIQSANGLATTRIKVGQKLKIPSKAEPASVAPAPAPAPVMDTAPAPALPPVSMPPSSTTGQ
jgi:LysM repeat protein